MTEVPQHLLRRAQAAKDKAAGRTVGKSVSVNPDTDRAIARAFTQPVDVDYAGEMLANMSSTLEFTEDRGDVPWETVNPIRYTQTSVVHQVEVIYKGRRIILTAVDAGPA